MLEPLVVRTAVRCDYTTVTHAHMTLFPGSEVAEDATVVCHLKWLWSREWWGYKPGLIRLEHTSRDQGAGVTVLKGVFGAILALSRPFTSGFVVEVSAQTLSVLREVFPQSPDAPVKGTFRAPPNLGRALTPDPVVLQFTTEAGLKFRGCRG